MKPSRFKGHPSSSLVTSSKSLPLQSKKKTTMDMKGRERQRTKVHESKTRYSCLAYSSCNDAQLCLFVRLAVSSMFFLVYWKLVDSSYFSFFSLFTFSLFPEIKCRDKLQIALAFVRVGFYKVTGCLDVLARRGNWIKKSKLRWYGMQY